MRTEANRAAPLHSHGTLATRLREALAIAAAAALWLVLALRWIESAQWHPALPVIVMLAGGFGLLAADLLSGVVHFVCDRFFAEDTPLIGRAFITPFREHHVDPAAITRHGFCERNGNNCSAVLPLLLVSHAVLQHAPAGPVHWALGAWLLAVTAALAATNEIHALAHAERVPAWARALQRAGVILPPRTHRLHHAGGHARAYCITTGWLNRPLDALDAFARLERVVRRTTRAPRGARPR